MTKEILLEMSPQQILQTPLYNKGSAFTREEREELGLHGLLPYHVSSIEEQVKRRYENFLIRPTQISKFLFLNSLQNRNEILFYRLVSEHITEMLPLIYTPTVGDISLHYGHLYREPRGLYIAYPEKNNIQKMIDQFKDRPIEVIVVTDGERILGLGDVGVGGKVIPIGKLSLYTLFGGIHPSRTLPIFLDVGTNNAEYLQDPDYVGWRHERVRGASYDAFVDEFVRCVKKTFPNVLLQWEDFAKQTARPLLDRYRNEILSFNDDIQGTATVVLAAALTACKKQKRRLKDQKIAVLGGGSAGLGICNYLVEAMMSEGCSEEEARSRFYIVDIHGLIHTNSPMDALQKDFAQDVLALKTWTVKDPNKISLLEVVRNAKPSILIGVSTQTGAFTEEIVKEMAFSCEHPLILPLSNPTSRSEARPVDLVHWTEAKALFATGSPFPSVEYKGQLYPSPQCNNVYIFPGVGLGAISCKAKKVTDRMFVAAAEELSRHSPLLSDPAGSLFPSFEHLKAISQEIAFAVGKKAIEEGVAPFLSDEALKKRIQENVWHPEYPIYKRAKTLS
jgi:malate dehydrogenase (oxaloacetate-decarboxylating)